MNTKDITIEHPPKPAVFYRRHAQELDLVGSDAFGQPVRGFAPQVAERFGKAEVAQVLRHKGEIVGFGLYDILRGVHWRLAIH